MSPELAAWAAFFKPQMSCAVRQKGKVVAQFTSENSRTPDGLLLFQRNFEARFSEIIVYAYDAKLHRYVRTELTNDGTYAVATSNGPVNGVWDWRRTAHSITSISPSAAPVLHWQRWNGVSQYWLDGKPWIGQCK